LLRRAIELAASSAGLAAATAGLGPMIVALHDARVAAEHVAAIGSVVLDALTRRLVELAVTDASDPPAPFTWFALGSLARRKAVPSSDVDSVLAWQDEGAGPAAGDYMARLARAVDQGLRACGMQPDAHGASASNPQFARSLACGRAQPQREPGAGAGAGPAVGDHRQPPGVGHRTRRFGRRCAVGGAGPAGPA